MSPAASKPKNSQHRYDAWAEDICQVLTARCLNTFHLLGQGDGPDSTQPSCLCSTAVRVLRSACIECDRESSFQDSTACIATLHREHRPRWSDWQTMGSECDEFNAISADWKNMDTYSPMRLEIREEKQPAHARQEGPPQNSGTITSTLPTSTITTAVTSTVVVTASAQTTPGSAPGSSSSSPNVAAIVGGVVGGIMLLALAIGLLWWRHRQRTQVAPSAAYIAAYRDGDGFVSPPRGASAGPDSQLSSPHYNGSDGSSRLSFPVMPKTEHAYPPSFQSGPGSPGSERKSSVVYYEAQ